jgi:predicted PurR-regulated permease PerM
MEKNTHRITLLITAGLSFLACFVFGFILIDQIAENASISQAQSNPSNPGSGATNTPQIQQKPQQNATDTTLGTPSAPITPVTIRETIVEGTGTTTELMQNPTQPTNPSPNSVQAPQSNQPGVTATPQITASNTEGAAQNAGTNATATARSGGLEIGLGIAAFLSLGFGYYLYKKRGDKKAILKTEERKIKL